MADVDTDRSMGKLSDATFQDGLSFDRFRIALGNVELPDDGAWQSSSDTLGMELPCTRLVAEVEKEDRTVVQDLYIAFIREADTLVHVSLDPIDLLPQMPVVYGSLNLLLRLPSKLVGRRELLDAMSNDLTRCRTAPTALDAPASDPCGGYGLLSCFRSGRPERRVSR